MPELLSPGIFIEEIPSQAQVIQAVSTSNMGIVGMAYRGPVDKATLVTSYPEYERTFGGLIRDSRMGLSMAAFFANGGRRAYVVRVVRSDACLANAQIQSKTTDQQLSEGDGATTTFSETAATSVLKDNSGASPIVPGYGTIRTRTLGTPVTGETCKQRDGLTDLQTTNGTLKYEGRIDPTSLPAYDEGLDSVVRGTVTITFQVAATPTTIVIPVGTGPIVSATNVGGSTAIFDHRTGFFSLLLDVSEDPDSTSDVTIDYTPASATLSFTLGSTLTAGQIDVSGTGLTGGGGIANSCDITVNDGAWELDFTTAPANKMPILITYKINAWDISPISKGVWGDDLRVTIDGNPNYYTAATGVYTRFDVNVYLQNPTSLQYELVEAYEELSLTDSTSMYYFPDVINDLSDYIEVSEPGADEAPGELTMVPRSQVIGGGDESTPNKTFSTTLAENPIGARTVSIAYTDSTDIARTITDDGNGNLTGDVDTSATNTITYTSGAIAFTTLNPIKAGTLVVVTYYTDAEESEHQEDFGDTSKNYTDSSLSPAKEYYEAGCEGTASLSRSEVSDPTSLETPQRGMYALDQVDEIMQVVIPDFITDTTVIGDELDYAENKQDKYIILAVPSGKTSQEAVDWFRYTLNRYSKFAALYWPWVKVADPLSNNRSVIFPPLGHIAGIYARTDITRNVGKSPGGTVDGQFRFITGLEKDTTKGDRDVVYQNKINPLISSPQTGTAVWGVRQIALESEWRYINARRLFMFLEKSVYNATFWIVFENNGPGLWTRIKLQLDSFLNNLFNEGYFAGTKPAEGYFVTVDETNNPQSSIDAGQVIIDIGVAPNKPAEFVRFRFQQKTLESSS
jgi:phage tail sheath protein FI